MPQTITLPRAPDTSLSNLGGIILGGVNDMADRRLAANRQAELRAQQLADVQDNRAYQRGLTVDDRAYQRTEDDRRRLLSLQDEQRKLEDQLKLLMFQDGILEKADFGNPDAVNAAYVRAAREGRIEKYKAIIDSGKLSVEQAAAGDAFAIEGGRQALGTQRSEQTAADLAREKAAQTNAQAMANQILIDERAIQEEMRLPPPVATDAQVLAAARQLWATANPGKQIPTTQEKLAAEMADARALLEERAMQFWAANQQQGKARLDNLETTKRTLIGAKAFGDPASLKGVVAPSQAQSPADADAARRAALEARARGNQSAAQPSPTVAAPAGNQPGMGGLGGLVERMAPNESFVAAAPRILGAGAELGTRGVQAALGGLLYGDASVPDRSVLSRAGTALGGFLAGDPAAVTAEDRILIEQPYSPKALEIKRRRSQEATRRALMLAQPTNNFESFTPPAAGQLRSVLAPN